MLEIPGYTVLRVLGEGGMGVVYLAVQQSLGRQVALKVLTQVTPLDAAASDAIRLEAQLAASLHHPHIVQVYDVGIQSGLPYMAMEYLPGGTVAEMTWGPDHVVAALRVVRDIALALDFAHKEGVVHRDVKPENILRHVDGSYMLSDFGIARTAEVTGFTTRNGLISGTPHYMSPEQWRGEKVDGRADLYSLGVVLYRLITGNLPYNANDAMAIGMLHTAADIPRLPLQAESVQPLLDEMMTKDREQRVQTGADVALLAEEAMSSLAQDSLRTRPISRRASAQVPPDAATRRPLWLGLAALALVLVLGVGAWRTWSVAPDGTDAAGGPPKGSIAVLPFTARSTASEDTYFAQGLADELQDALSAVPGLVVAARNSAFAASQKSVDPKIVGAALNVATVLSATVRREGTKVRISAELADARTGNRLWSQAFDKELTDIFAVQREIAQQAVEKVLGALPSSDRPLAQRLAVTGDVGAYDAYLRGLQILHRSSSARNLAAAISQFDQALARDPRFARAQAGICTAEIRRYETAHEADAMTRGRAACERAQAMDGSLREVDLALGDLNRVQGERERASGHYTRALDNVALRAEAYLGLARLEAKAKHDDLALKYFDLARSADAGYWQTFFSRGNFLQSRGKSDDAIDAFRTAITLAPDDAISPWNNLGAVYFQREQYEEAAEAFARSVKIDPSHSALSNLGSVRFFLGDYAEAATLYRRATQLAKDDHQSWGNLGDALGAQPGKEAEARAAYLEGVRTGGMWLTAHPDDARATAEVAWFRANLGEANDARDGLARAEALGTDTAEVATLAAQAYAKLGDEAAARARIAKAREAGVPERQLLALPGLKTILAKGGGLG